MENSNLIIFYIFSGILGLILIYSPSKNNDPTTIGSCDKPTKFILYIIWVCLIIAITLLFTYIFNKYIK